MRRTQARAWISAAVACAVVATATAPTALAGETTATTTVTTYQYNADGAPTAITTQVGDAAPTTVYLTWDNFTPSAADATTGTVSRGNGNLAARGSSPGTAAASAAYRFDRRDRLVGYRGGGQQLTYTYHPDGTLAASTAAAGTALQCYYDGGGRMTNLRQADLWSGQLGHLRAVSDGSRQILLTPRKDIGASYDAAAQALSPYQYDAYGAETRAAGTAATYDIHDNPFRYAGAYRDALTGEHYLRARWYDPRCRPSCRAIRSRTPTATATATPTR